MRDLFKSLFLALTAGVLFGFTACVTDAGGKKDEGVTSVSLTASNDSKVKVGETITLIATPNAWPATEKYEWSVSSVAVGQINGSSDSTVTTEENTVNLKGIAVGTVEVSVTVDGVKSNTITVTVEAADPVVTTPVLQSVELSGSTSIAATGTSTLTASPTFSTGTATPEYTWEITAVNGSAASSTEFATLTGNGASATLKGNNTTTSEKKVTVQVTATYNGVSKTASLTVTIAAAQDTVTNELKTLSLVAESASIHRGENSILTAVATYSGTVSLTYEWAITAVDGTAVSSTEYAALSSEIGRDSRAVTTVNRYNTLTSANKTASNHTVTVTLTASDGTVTKTATAVVTLIGDSITGISVDSDETQISDTGTADFTATVNTSHDSVEYEVTWAITAVDGTAVSSTDWASLVTNSDGSATLTGSNTDSASHVITVTATATNKNDSTNKESTTRTINILQDGVSAAYYPIQGTAEAYADTYLELEFDSTPTVNRGSSKTVRIYKADGTLVDTIATDGETMYGYGYSGKPGLGSINVQYQLIQVIGNKVRIIPHHNTSTGLTLLENSTSYYVLIDDGLITGTLDGSAFAGITETTGWTFTTGAAPVISGNTITVGDGGNFITVQGAFSWMMANSKKGDWTIKIEPGTYYERIFYSGSANITMSGQGSAEYGTDVEIQWCNQDGGDPTKVTNTLWNYGSRGRNVFYYCGGNLVLENLSIINTATRKSNEYGEYDSTVTSDNANGNNQAEALLFDSTGNCAAYNCNFKSKQDTIYLSPSGGKAWFYGCKIAGDVDFIWGLSDVALFERCNIISAYDSDKSSNHETYIVAPHLATGTAPYGKGFVLYNCDVTTESGQKTYLARSPWGSSGNISQVAIIDTAVTGGLESNPWYGSHVGGDDETVLGWKWYGVTSDGSEISAAHKLSQAQYAAEFAGRNNIINRTYDGSAFSKAASTWDVNALAQTMGWNVVTDNSKATLDGESEITSVTFDFTAVSGVSAWDTISSITSTDSSTTATLSGFRWHSTTYGANTGSANATAVIPVTGACTVTVYNSYTSDTDVSISAGSSTADEGTAAAGDSCTLTYSGSAASLTVTIAASGTYISKIVVTYTSSGNSSSGEETEVTVTYFPSSTSSFSAAGTSSDTGIVTAANAAALTETGGTLTTAFGDVNSVSGHYYSTGKVSGTADDTILTLTLSLTAVEDFTIKSITGSLNESATGNISRTLKVGSNTAVSLGSGKELSVDQTGINYAVTAGNTVSIVFTTTATASYSDKTFKQLFKDIVITVSTTASGSGNSGSGTSSEGETASLSDVIIDNGSAISDGDTSSRSSSLAISATDTPTGYAGVSSPFGSMSWTTYTVSTRSDLVSKAKHSSGNYFIIVDGMIDMTDGMLPSVGGGTTDELDAFVNTKTSGAYTTYAAWVEAYAEACSLTSDDETSGSGNTTLYSTLWTLSDAYKSQIQLVVKSNTIIVGKDASSGIKGANISMNGVSNVELRNLIIQDAYDPFPHHEVKDDGVTSDGYNAQWDCITIQGDCSYIWIDHCTIQDTMTLGHVYTGGTGGTSEKWQTYDGLLDIKGTGANITVSYCKFKNHDKTSLIGSSDSEGSSSTRLITYHHNYFYNCGQRLPMVRNTTMHLYNNYYAYSSGPYSQQYAVGVRKGSVIYAEGNYFDSGIKYAFSDSGSSSSSGTLYSSGNTNNASSGQSLSNSVGSTLFSAGPAAYTYTAESASTVKANLPNEAGSGSVTIN